MAVDEKYRGLGVGHKMFEFLKVMKIEKTWMELNCKLMQKTEPHLRCIKNVVLQKSLLIWNCWIRTTLVPDTNRF